AGAADGFVDCTQHVALKGNDLQGTGALDGDVRHLLDRRIGTVIRHHHAFKNARMRLAGTNTAEVVRQRFHGLFHALLSVFLDFVDHCWPSSIRVPSAPPCTMFSRAPGLFMLNTRNGILWSRHRQIAVRSITPSLRSSTSS